ncbi:MAG TPA: hypothetical protein VGO93_04640, partial [Candidatus Xenobia bacterium]|jgi:threonine/homoserine/homoserine lactone efflux protein
MVGLGSKEASESVYAISPLAALGISSSVETTPLTLVPGLACNAILLLWFGLRSWQAERVAAQEMAA